MPEAVRPEQPKTVARTASILYLGRAYQHCGYQSVTIAIDSVRWEYTLTAQQADTVEYLARRVSLGKALAFAKRKAKHEARL